MARYRTETKRPTHQVFYVLGDGDKARDWLEIGTAWKTGKDEFVVNVDRAPFGGWPIEDDLTLVVQPFRVSRDDDFSPKTRSKTPVLDTGMDT